MREIQQSALEISICDDEAVFVEKIDFYARKYFQSKGISIHIAQFQSPKEMLQSDVSKYDIIFLDVDMPQMSGIELGKELRRVNRKAILVYVSAFVQYAIDGYSVHAFQYLLKQDLDRTFARCMDDVRHLLPSMGTYFIATDAGGVRVPLSDILYFEAQRHKLIAHTQNHQRNLWEFSGKISDLEVELKDVGFLRTHKGFLINMRNIARMEKSGAILINGEILPCSRQNFKDLLRAYILWEGIE